MYAAVSGAPASWRQVCQSPLTATGGRGMKLHRLNDDGQECGQLRSGAGRYGRAGTFSRLLRALVFPVILSLAMAAAACGDSEPAGPPLTPLPAAAAPMAESAPATEASSPLTPIPAAAAAPAATAAPAPSPIPSPDPVLTVAQDHNSSNYADADTGPVSLYRHR